MFFFFDLVHVLKTKNSTIKFSAYHLLEGLHGHLLWRFRALEQRTSTEFRGHPLAMEFFVGSRLFR